MLGQVVSLANVLCQIVEFHRSVLIPFNKLVVTFPYGPAQTVAAVKGVIGIVEVKGRSPQRSCLFEQGQQALTVERFVGLPLNTGDLQQGRVEIHADHRCPTDRARFNAAGPSDDQRHADAALVQVSFRGAQRRQIGHAAEGTVVGGKDNERLFREFKFVQGLQYATYGPVHGLDHGGVASILEPGTRAVLIDQGLRRLHGPMHRIVPQGDEEGSVPMFADEVDGFIRQTIGQVCAVLSGLDAGNAIGLEIAGRPPIAAPANITIESLELGTPLGLGSFHFAPRARKMPLADKRIGITGPLKMLGDGDIVQRQKVDRLGRPQRCVVRLESLLVGDMIGDRESRR